jgi:hypothetical protein
MVDMRRLVVAANKMVLLYADSTDSQAVSP